MIGIQVERQEDETIIVTWSGPDGYVGKDVIPKDDARWMVYDAWIKDGNK